MPSTSNIPAWVDEELSNLLQEIVAGGERQDVELKERLPDQMRDLAKEVAAFATSNSGTIFIGVSDSGEIVGLDGAQTVDGRNAIIARIEGICSNGIKPPIIPSHRFAYVNDRVVVALDVPKGASPVYYVGGVPYVRQMTTARPAEPQEVIDLILLWNTARGPQKPKPEEEFLTRLAGLIIGVIVYEGELADRQVNPWLDQVRYKFQEYSEIARDLSISPPEVFADLSLLLEEMADFLDTAAHQRLTIGSGWTEVQEAASAALAIAGRIRTECLDRHRVEEASKDALRKMIKEASRKLTNAAARAETLADHGRLEEVQQIASECGLSIVRAAAYGWGLGSEERIRRLMEVGRALRNIEVTTVYMDGGRSERAIISEFRKQSAALQELEQQ